MSPEENIMKIPPWIDVVLTRSTKYFVEKSDEVNARELQFSVQSGGGCHVISTLFKKFIAVKVQKWWLNPPAHYCLNH
jgi:hypothetical protein